MQCTRTMTRRHARETHVYCDMCETRTFVVARLWSALNNNDLLIICVWGLCFLGPCDPGGRGKRNDGALGLGRGG